jgi:zinc transporter ZupT
MGVAVFSSDTTSSQSPLYTALAITVFAATEGLARLYTPPLSLGMV